MGDSASFMICPMVLFPLSFVAYGFFSTDAVTGLKRILLGPLLGGPPSGAILTKIMCVRSLRSIQRMLKRDLEGPFCGFSLVVAPQNLMKHCDII